MTDIKDPQELIKIEIEDDHDPSTCPCGGHLCGAEVVAFEGLTGFASTKAEMVGGATIQN